MYMGALPVSQAAPMTIMCRYALCGGVWEEKDVGKGGWKKGDVGVSMGRLCEEEDRGREDFFDGADDGLDGGRGVGADDGGWISGNLGLEGDVLTDWET